ncbi:MAG: AAA family ATPase, partial [Rhodospirillales bacterium]|nr:AAA family ATPase [Acetobacter sp.]
MTEDFAASGVQAAEELFRFGAREIGRVIAGQDEAIALAVAAVLCGGHALVEGVPGLAKTLTVKTLGHCLGVDFRRIQGTPDMMPADILGTTVFTPALDSTPASFRFHPGPVFTQFLLADEINRMPPRTQAALLEAMEERQVTADGNRHALDKFFTVFATQNPVEFEGTYPLPEAQLDRFLLKIAVQYPTAEDERLVLERHHGPVLLHDEILETVESGLLAQARREVRAVQVESELFDYILAVVRRTRVWPAISLGASPRAGTSLLLVAKAL